MSGHERAAEDRVSPNLRSTDRPLLDGRAMIHLGFKSGYCDGSGYAGYVAEGCGTEVSGRHSEIGKLGTEVLISLVGLAQHSVHIFADRHPICYSA